MNQAFARYKKDIDRLVQSGGKLVLKLQAECHPKVKELGGFTRKDIEDFPALNSHYENWYSEALALVKQLLPDRVEDFKGMYAPRGPRKEISHANYTMSDYMRGTTIRLNGEVRVGPASAFTNLHQQWNMISGLQDRLESTLFDIRTLVHADLLDNELHAAEELNKKGFTRAAGAVAGVVLEGHLGSVCQRHALQAKKKNPSIADFNETLKSANVVDIVQWRFVQHLGDIRNKCDHKGNAEPTKEDVLELIEGVKKVTKTVL
jgi:hypothetical protein